MTSDYSGWDAPREAMRICAPQVVANPDVQFVRSCDWGSQQHKVLCEESKMFSEGVQLRLPRHPRPHAREGA